MSILIYRMLTSNNTYYWKLTNLKISNLFLKRIPNFLLTRFFKILATLFTSLAFAFPINK